MCFETAAIETMFDLGHNVDLTPREGETSAHEVERAERIFEDNRSDAIEKNPEYIRRKPGTQEQ